MLAASAASGAMGNRVCAPDDDDDKRPKHGTEVYMSTIDTNPTEPDKNHRFHAISCSYESVGVDGCHDIARIIGRGGPLKLEQVEIQNDSVGDHGLQILAHAAPRSILKLDLRCNSITDVGLTYLLKAIEEGDKAWPNPIQTLTLSCNNFTSKGLKALGKVFGSSPSKTKLKHLALDDCHIDGHGGEALAKACAKSSTLLELTLYRNDLGDKGANAFVEALPASKLEKLDLRANAISEETSRALRTAMHKCPKQMHRYEKTCRILGLHYSDWQDG